MGISSPITIQHAASCEQYLSEVPVTLLGRPKKVEEVKKELCSPADCSGLQQNQRLSNSKTKVLLCKIRLVQGHVLSLKEFFAKIQQNNHQLNNLFELQKLVYCCEDKTTFLNCRIWFIVAKTRTPKLQKTFELSTIACSQLQFFKSDRGTDNQFR